MSLNAQPYILARSAREPDREFPSLSALARELMALRFAEPGKPRLNLCHAEISRGDLPGGAVISVRLADGRCAGWGSPLGYVFMPRIHAGHELAALRQALAGVVEQAA